MSTLLLPEVVPEIDANPMSFYSGGGLGIGHGLENDANLLLPLGTKSKKVFSFWGALPFPLSDHLIRSLPLDPAGGSTPDPRYGLALRALTMRVHVTFFDLATPCTYFQSCSCRERC